MVHPDTTKLFYNVIYDKIFLSYVLALLISITTVILRDYFWYELVFLIIIIISTFIALLFKCLMDYNIEMNKHNPINYIAKDITITDYETLIIFDKISLDKGCINRENRKIRNNMTTTYNKYLVKIGSSSANEFPEDITFFINGEEQPELKNQIKPTYSVCEDLSDRPHSLPNIMQFYFPVNIPPGETIDFGFKYRTKSFEDALHQRPDFDTTLINFITERLHIGVKITEGMEKHYKISYPSDEQGIKDLEIVDSAGERMFITEHDLKYKEKMKPSFSNKNSQLDWQISYPKVGYKYTLHFTFTQIK